jgi:hypothetical protein
MAPGRKNICKAVAAIAGIIIVIALCLAYFQYLTLKKSLVSQISGRLSSFAGQEVKIRDLLLDPAAGISIRDFVIENPEGFEKGQLLKIKLLTFRLKYSELLSGRLSFDNIIVDRPEVTLRKDKSGRFNISDALRSFLTKKGTIEYRIGTVKIRQGLLDVQSGRQYLINNIGITLDRISSDAGTKTFIKASASLPAEGRFSAEGWAFLKSDPKRFGLSASVKDVRFSRVASLLGIDERAAEAKDFDISIDAEGDTRKGVDLKTKVRLGQTGFLFFGKRKTDITLAAEMFLDIRADALVLRNAVLNAGEASSAQLSGSVHDITGDPSYDAKVKVDIGDLSAFNPLKGIKVGGTMTSDAVHIRGKVSKKMPYISGSVRLHGVSLQSEYAEADAINASITFSSEAELAARGEASARILRAGRYVLGEPATAMGTLDVRGKPASWKLVSSLEVTPVQIKFGGENALRAQRIHAAVTGSMERGAFSGSGSTELAGIKYGNYSLQRCGGTSALNYTGDVIALRNPKISSDLFLISADAIRMEMPRRKARFLLEIANLKGSYPVRRIEIRQMDGSVRFMTSGESASGDITLSKGRIFFQDRILGDIFGRAKFDKKVFSLDLQGSELFKGTVKLSAEGKASGGPFPMTITLTADSADLSALYSVASEFIEIPYRLSGMLDHASFHGSLESMNSVNGSAVVHAKQLSVIKSADNKTIVKDGAFDSEAAFRGSDADFKADASAGGLSASFLGVVNEFMQKDRSIRIRAAVPETTAADIRNAFWDVFPDKLLYAGLQGALSADISIGFGKGGLSAGGELRLKDLKIEGENNEYSAGPVNGTIPISYREGDDRGAPLSLPSFEGAEYQKLSEYYARKKMDRDYIRVTAGTLRYGFRLFEDIEIWLNQSGGYLNISRFTANIFGGRLDGSAVVSFSGGLNYRAGLIVKGISLTRLCDDITPIKGYISGKVDGTAFLKGTGGGMNGLIGKADFWSYSAGGEKTKISREFLYKIGGPSVQAYLGERPFDKGIISLYLEKGYLIFRELEISHKNFFGMTDLSVKVVPLNNRIAIEHLMETITEAAERAKDK